MNSNQQFFSEEAFRVLAETAPDCFIIADAASQIIFVNKKVKDIFGYEPSELLGQNISLITPEKYREAHQKGVDRYLATNSPKIVGRTVEIEGLHKSGKIIPIELSLSHWKADDKHFFTSIIRDISDRKKAFKELHFLQTVYKTISTADDFQSALKLTIQHCCEFLDWDYGEVWVPDQTKSYIEFGAVWYAKNDNTVLSFIEKTKPLKIPLDRGMAEKVFHGGIAWNPDLTLPNNPFSRAKASVEAGFYSCVGIPVVFENEVVVSFLLFSREKREEDQEVKKTIITVAEQLGNLLQRKKTEDALREREHFIVQVANSTPDVIGVYDFIDQVPVFANHEFTEILGYPVELTKNWDTTYIYSLIHPDDVKLLQERHAKLESSKEGEKFEIEYRLKAMSGDYKWVRSRSTVFKRTEKGQLRQVLTLMSDITEKKNAEEELSKIYAELEDRIAERTKELYESKERLSLVLKASQLGIWDSNFETGVRKEDERARELYGVKEGEELTYDFAKQVILKEDWQIFEDAFRRSLNPESGGELDVEFRIFHPIWKKVLWLRSKGLTLFDQNGNPVRSLGTVIDITARKQAEEEILNKNRELVKINHDLDNFIYTASHDLKAPITNIEGLINALSSILESPDSAKEDLNPILSMIYSSIARFKKTLADLTDISKVQKDLSEPEEQVDLHEMVDEIKDSIKDMIESTSAAIETDFSRLNQLYFCRKNLRSIFYNLVSNGIKYRDPARIPHIQIISYLEEKFAVLEFNDNGLGFDDSNHNKLFGMFKRMHPHVEGSGIGLYIVKRIIDNAGGKILVKSTIGIGSQFKVYLPIKI